MDFRRALSDPTAVLLNLYSSYRAHGPFSEKVSESFEKLFDGKETFQQIPALDAHYGDLEALLAAQRPLVRFRGMIQSTEHEVYQAEMPNHTLGGWGLAEDAHLQESTDEQLGDSYHTSGLGDRSTLWAVSIPGESDWVASGVDGRGTRREKGSPTSAQPHKHPFPLDPHFGVNVKLYCDPSKAPKLTEVLTFVGILTEEPLLLSELHTELSVPTLHVLFYRPQTLPIQVFPYPMKLIPSPPNGDEAPTLQAAAGSSPTERVRSALIQWIADEGLAGDLQAAEWVLLSTISRTFSRAPPILPLSVTLSSVPLPSTMVASANDGPSTPTPEPSIKHILSLLLPAVVHIPISIKLLNESRMAPISRNEDLHSGALQLPDGTTVIVSDIDVSEGTVTQSGLENVKALKQCVSAQILAYSFPYSDYTFKTSLNFLVLAQGKSSPFVQTDVNIPLRGTSSSPYSAFYKPPSDLSSPESDVLASFRALIGGARTGKVDIPEDVSKYIQDDFVQERQRDKTVNTDDLVLRMTVARLLTLSLHEPLITKDIWERAKTLDSKRKASTG